MRYFYASVVLLCLLLCVNTGYAQYAFQQLDNSSGLSNSCMNNIFQDSDHIIWFGTWDGLNFYDGTNVHVFNYEKADPRKKSIASNVIYKIAEDKSRNIWIGTVEGVSRFNKNTGDFSNYFYNRKKAISNGYTIATDLNGMVYAAKRNGADLYCYDAKYDAFNKVKITGLNNFLLVKMQFDEHNNLWLLRDNGVLDCYAKSAGGFTKLEQFATVADVDNVMFCNHQIFYATRGDDLVRVDDQFQKTNVLKLSHEVRAMGYYRNHYVLAWSAKGIGEYDETFKPAVFLTDESSVLQNVRITTMMNDDNLLWLGTDGSGVIKITKRENYFGLIQKQSNGQSFHIPVRAFSSVGNELWVGTKGNGIITISNWDKKDLSFSNIKTFHTQMDLLDNCVYAMEKGNDGLMYIGSDAPGITLYDLKTKKFIKWEDIPNNKQFPSFGSVHCILYDSDGSVWLGLNESGLVHLKLEKDQRNQISIKYLQHYKVNETNGPGSNVIYSLAAGGDNRIWIGCRYGGLTCFNKATGRFTTLKAFSYDGSLSNNDVLSVYIDRQRRLWVGTSFGLNWLDEAEAGANPKPIFKKLNVDNGLPNNTIHAITEDSKGNVWLSTNKGLARINPASLKIVQFKEADGLQSDEFSDNAVWKNETGMLFFGGIYGFNYFVPENIKVSTEQPHLLVTDLRFAGKYDTEKGLQVLTRNGPVVNQRYELGPQDNYFELNVQPITYVHSQKCQYAYYLEGNDKEWHYVGNHEKIIYNNLSPGRYRLMVKWSNGEGAWTPGISVFNLTIKPYFWLTSLAFLLYAFVLLISGYAYFRYRKNKFMIRQELKMEHMLREKDEALHQEQLNFFTNIAHELQTPLTLILGSLERHLYKNKNQENANGNYFLSIVKQEASRLHYLVLQLLEFRKAETGFLKNHFTYLNASKLLTNISQLFDPLAEPKGLDFSCHIEPDISLWIDKDKLEKIIFNLLSNAFKHSVNNQSIIFSVHQLPETKELEIVVANSGCKLNDDELHRLFDRFFVVDDGQQNKISSGIGLAFTRQLLSLLNGNISVKCEDRWISFKVLLPLSFVPEHHQLVADIGDKSEKPSFLLQSITNEEDTVKQVTVDENNKKAMIKSFEQDDKKMVLIVEDEQRIRYLLKDILSEYYIVYEAATGKEALEVIHRITPDLIISDIMMPDFDGLQLCNVIKTTPATCHIPFVILSARGTLEQKTEGYESGADAYIPKPFQTEHLLVRVHKLLEYRDKLHKVFSENSRSASHLHESDIKNSDKNFIEKVVKVIEDNLDEELDGAFLENALNLSKIQLYRKIKSLSNMTPTELIRHLRLQKSAILLKTSDLTVSEIFYRTGFNNKTYFFREFKRVYNCSPNAYRAQQRLPDLN